jgi:hypothetical protein
MNREVWLGRVLQVQVDYLKAENQLLREKIGTKRMRLTNAERSQLDMLGKALTARVGITLRILALLTRRMRQG